MSKYLQLFANALGMGKSLERSRYELETDKSQLAEDGGREVRSTLEESSSSKEEEEAKPKTCLGTKQAIKTGNDLLRGYRYILDCTCGSWGHPCEEVAHYCPTKCLKTVEC